VDTSALPHITKVELLKQGYLAACSCDWRGPYHPNPEPAVQDAIAHERNPWGPESQKDAVAAANGRSNGYRVTPSHSLNGKRRH
jgi:hypothetical protein